MDHISEDTVKEYRIAILIKDIDISKLMVHARQIQERRLRRRKRIIRRP